MKRDITECRVCQGTNLETYLDLGTMPLVNNLPTRPDQQDARFPLEVKYCNDCSLSQLGVVVDPSVLFSNYVYRSSISKTFVNHCAELAKTAHDKLGMKENDLVIDIASNDGCALRQFAPYKVRTLGVDPAQNLASIANKDGISTVPSFWSPAMADYIMRDKGAAKIVTAMNVFGHVDNIKEFVHGIDRVLADDGTFIVEVPYLVDLLKNNIFDTVYHEHLSYFLASPMAKCFSSNGLHINHVDRIDIHGGTLRVYAQKKQNPDASINDLLDREKAEGYLSKDMYWEFQKKADATRADLVAMVRGIKSSKKTIAAFGASAKGSIMLNYCKLGPKDISFVVDDTPEKQNKYMAGTHIPILP
ncbi:MAG TPA: class I SAM-dependent methyltransferase, partial [Candidatus Binatia bacterium]|nr:class I SAM-dependent methyltransferase [Candidatus Binatia bacterium]